jgi:hypothetical protein
MFGISESPESRIFDEKLSMSELIASTDKVVDEQGNSIVIGSTIGGSSGKNLSANTIDAVTTTTKTLED